MVVNEGEVGLVAGRWFVRRVDVAGVGALGAKALFGGVARGVGA